MFCRGQGLGGVEASGKRESPVQRKASINGGIKTDERSREQKRGEESIRQRPPVILDRG